MRHTLLWFSVTIPNNSDFLRNSHPLKKKSSILASFQPLISTYHATLIWATVKLRAAHRENFGVPVCSHCLDNHNSIHRRAREYCRAVCRYVPKSPGLNTYARCSGVTVVVDMSLLLVRRTASFNGESISYIVYVQTCRKCWDAWSATVWLSNGYTNIPGVRKHCFCFVLKNNIMWTNNCSTITSVNIDDTYLKK